MRVSDTVSADHDDPNLVSTAGLLPVMGLAEEAGLHDLVADRVTVPGPAGANAAAKIPALVVGMVAGADSITDMGLLRHGGLGRLFTAGRAPTTLGTHLRAYTFGHVRQLDAVASRLLAGLVSRVPGLVSGAEEVAYLDVDDTIRETHGYAKQGTGYGYSGVRGLNAQLATLSTPTAAPVITGTRLRRGSAASAHGAPRLIGEAIATARRAGATATITVRADSAYYNRDVVAAVQTRGARFSTTARMDPAVTAAISFDPGGELDCDPVPQRDLGGGRGPVDLRRRGRRGPLHRVHLAEEGRARHRAADRAPGQSPQPRHGPGRPGRAARCLPAPRGVYRLAPEHARR